MGPNPNWVFFASNASVENATPTAWGLYNVASGALQQAAAIKTSMDDLTTALATANAQIASLSATVAELASQVDYLYNIAYRANNPLPQEDPDLFKNVDPSKSSERRCGRTCTSSPRTAGRRKTPRLTSNGSAASLERLRTDYVDSYYLHGVTGREIPLLSEPTVKAVVREAEEGGQDPLLRPELPRSPAPRDRRRPPPNAAGSTRS